MPMQDAPVQGAPLVRNLHDFDAKAAHIRQLRIYYQQLQQETASIAGILRQAEDEFAAFCNRALG